MENQNYSIKIVKGNVTTQNSPPMAKIFLQYIAPLVSKITISISVGIITFYVLKVLNL